MAFCSHLSARETRLTISAMQIRPKLHATACITFALALTACSTPNGNFPSLSKRPYESADPLAIPEATPETQTTSMPDRLIGVTQSLLARNRTGQSQFAAALPASRSSAQSAAGATFGSEGWAQAHVMLSRLDASRADSVAALGEIDHLIAVERDKGADKGLLALLGAVQDEIADTVAGQKDVLAQLFATIGR